MKTQPELPLRAMSGSITMERHGSLLMFMNHITITKHGDFLDWDSCQNHVDVPGMCRTGPTVHWLGHYGELISSLTSSIIQHSGAGLGGHGVGKPVSRV